MKTLVIGAGGVGGYYGGLLAKAGNDVTFLARGDHAKALRQSGLQLTGAAGDFLIKPVRVASTLNEIENPELVLICVKAYDLENIARDLASIASDRTLVIPFQNGIDSEQVIAKFVPNAIVVSGITWVISKRAAPGVIETGSKGTIIFGDRNGKHQELLNTVQASMCYAGIDAKNSQSIERELWLKYLWILGFAGMTSLCRSSIGPIANDENTLAVYTRCLKEAFSVATHLKVDVNDDDYQRFLQRIEAFKKSNPAAKTSMLIDIENHRQTEVESLHGKLCLLAKQFGIDVPVNEIIYATVRLTHPEPAILAK